MARKNSFADRLNKEMVARGIDKKILSVQSNIDLRTINHYLKGETVPSSRNIFKLASALGVNPSRLDPSMADNTKKTLNDKGRSMTPSQKVNLISMFEKSAIGDDTETFGIRLSRLIDKNGFSFSELGSKIGLHEGTITRYVSGERNPSDKVIEKLASSLNTTTDYLKYGECSERDFKKICKEASKASFYLSNAQIIEIIKQLVN